MKKRFYLLAVTLLLTAVTVITSCNWSSNKSNKNVEDTQQDLEQKKKDAELQYHKVATTKEWEDFKIVSEIEIKQNEIRIEELKRNLLKPGVTLDSLRQQRINTLEEKNNDLKAKIRTYEKDKGDWETFKREFKHDMDEFGEAFKDLTIDNIN